MKVFGTLEWAKYNENLINGCSHDCKYCYSKEMAIRFKRKTPENWKFEDLNQAKLLVKPRRRNGRIMFPSSHDITEKHIENIVQYLEGILSAGNKVLIVSKPHFSCIKAMCDKFQRYKSQIIFRFSIGSANSNVLLQWEPFAPGFSERMSSLKLAFEQGFATSISCEPVLDNNTERLVELVEPYITDSIWIGRVNFLRRRLIMNKQYDDKTRIAADQLMKDTNDEYFMELSKIFSNGKKIKWKDSVKNIIGIDMPENIGMDI